jgi:hypothetical protein
VLSLHKLFLPCEIHYWCQFDNGVSINDLWYHRKTESPLWMYTQGYAAWRMLVSRSLAMIHYETTLMCYLPLTSHWNNFYVVCQVIKQHLSSLLDQKGIPLSYMVSFLLILVVTTYTSSLCILCCKGGALELFSVKRQLISSQNGDLFHCCWDAGVCSFTLLFNPWIP